MNYSTTRLRFGVTIIELVVVIFLIGAMAALFIPAIQAARESARNLTCQNNLKNLGIAVANYESANGHIPPGTLGFKKTFVVDAQFVSDWESEPEFEYYWKRTQHTSFLVLILPFLDSQTANSKLPRSFTQIRKRFDECFEGSPPVSWVGEFPEVDQLARREIPFLGCPSDSLGMSLSGTQISNVGSQPVYFLADSGPRDAFMGKQILDLSFTSSTSNYGGCSGAHSGGRVPHKQMSQYIGAFSSRSPTSMARITDGSSNTVLIGETLGFVRDNIRIGGHVWCFGGLIRGRGKIPWGLNRHPTKTEVNLFGYSRYSHISSFGSLHPAHVNTVFADGSVHAIRRDISIATWYQLCGISDGNVIQNDGF